MLTRKYGSTCRHILQRFIANLNFRKSGKISPLVLLIYSKNTFCQGVCNDGGSHVETSSICAVPLLWALYRLVVSSITWGSQEQPLLITAAITSDWAIIEASTMSVSGRHIRNPLLRTVYSRMMEDERQRNDNHSYVSSHNEIRCLIIQNVHNLEIKNFKILDSILSVLTSKCEASMVSWS